MKSLPDGSIDLVFADPPYNMQLSDQLMRPDHSIVDAVDDEWDQFESFEVYDAFTRSWLTQARRVLKPTGAIWVIGTYHNIHRVGAIMQDLGFWLMNDVAWVKSNPMPQFRGVRFCNAHETLIWAKRSREQRSYKFNYQSIKAGNEDLQVRSDWNIPICSGSERLRNGPDKVHSTQKPEALISRILVACSDAGDVVLDPFFGSGTTGAVARKLQRHYIGIERETHYIEAGTERISQVEPAPDESLMPINKPQRVSFNALLDLDLIQPGQFLWLEDRSAKALVRADGALNYNGMFGSIHRLGAELLKKPSCNGWDTWFVDNHTTGEFVSIDDLREDARKLLGLRGNVFMAAKRKSKAKQ